MSLPQRVCLNGILLGDELGQLKYVQFQPRPKDDDKASWGAKRFDYSDVHDEGTGAQEEALGYSGRCDQRQVSQRTQRISSFDKRYHSKTLQANRLDNPCYRVVRVLDECLPQDPALSRSITSIRPIESVLSSHLDTTDKPNNLFLVTNRVGQLFVCNTDAVRRKIQESDSKLISNDGAEAEDGRYDERSTTTAYDATPLLSPVYYNMNNEVPVCGAQPINQTNILVIYSNGDIQHVNIGQDILQASLRIKRKAIRTLGLGYNSDARAIHWRIDGSSGIAYFDSDAVQAHLNDCDPLTDIVLSSPTHKMNMKKHERGQQDHYHKSPCIQARRYNQQDRLVPTQVINMITSHADRYKPHSHICKWSSITSLNLIYRKLGLYDLVGSENFERSNLPSQYGVKCYKLNDNRLAIGGNRYALRVYDVQTQKPIYNCLTGAKKNPLVCSAKGEPIMIGDIDWLGGNKTTKRSPNMLASCSGVDSVVRVFDLRSSRPVFYIDLTQETENRWQPYEHHPQGCMFTSICASGASYSTAVPSQQLALGSTNGQLHIIDLRFVARSQRTLGKLSGFCGGSIREIRFVSESFECSKMISCATDRFVRIHKIQTSFTSVISQKLTHKIFLGTKPSCVQPVCDEVVQNYLSSIPSHFGSESHISTIGSGSWSLL